MRIKIPDFRNGFSGSDLEHLKNEREISGLEFSKGGFFPSDHSAPLQFTSLLLPKATAVHLEISIRSAQHCLVCLG